MCLAGACGRWAPGLTEPAFDAERLVLAGVRELDSDERVLLEASGATLLGPTLETLVGLVNALDSRPVYVHLDLDVLDPEVMPAHFPSPGGLPPEKLYDLLEAVSDECELVGIEVTCFPAPEDEGEAAALAEVVADCVGAALGEGTQPF
jgi:arginase family enzyme